MNRRIAPTALVIGLFVAPAAALQSPAQSVQANNPGKVPVDGLEAEPMEFELLGMRFRPPAGSVMRADGKGAAATWIVTERADPPRFILKVSRLVASEAASSPREQIDSYVKAASERPAPDSVFSVRDRKEFALDGRPAAILYTSRREGTGKDEVSAVEGYFMVQVAPNEFIVMSALLADEDFTGVSILLERSFRTVTVRDAGDIARERNARLGRGQHLLDGLDEEALRRALDPVPSKGAAPAPRWYRISRVDAAGDVQETGYMTMSAVEAPQGAANPDRAAREWTAQEKEPGLMVLVRVRTLLDAAGTAVNDTDARYWVRWDRGREFWTVRSTMRRGRSTRSSSQLGIRTEPTSGSPRPALEVADVVPSEAAAPPRRWPVPDVAYLSQAEALVLPRLLGAVREPAELGFYWFDARSGRLAQRLDRVQPAAEGFRMATRATLEAPPVDSELDRRGLLLRRAGDDGSVVEATTGEALLALWKQKGLPTQ